MLDRLRTIAGDLLHRAAHTVDCHDDGVVAKAILPVADMDEATAFHELLGFEVVAYDAGYAWVTQPSGEVHHLALVPDLDRAANAAALYLHVPDVDAWHARLTAAGIGAEPLVDQPWGLRETAVTDPSGNRIRMGSPHR